MHLNPWREAREAREVARDLMAVGLQAQRDLRRVETVASVLHRNLGDLLDVAEGETTNVTAALQVILEARRVHNEVTAVGDVLEVAAP